MKAERIIISTLLALWLVLGGVADAQFQATLHGEPELTPLSELSTPHVDELLAQHGKDAELPITEIFAGEDDDFRRKFDNALRSDASSRRSDYPHFVEYLVYALTDPVNVVWQSAFGTLMHLEEDAFSPASRDMLRRMEGPKHSGGWTRLLGAANIPEVIDYATDYLEGQEQVEPGSEAWLCLLVLAKYGDDESINRVIETALESPDWRGSLSRDLIYIKQPEVIDLVLELLFSDEVIQHSHSPPYDLRWEGVGLMSLLVADFPLDRRRFGHQYSDEEVELLRQWAADYQGTWRVLYQRVDLRENPEDFPWAVEQQRQREAEREAQEREWRARGAQIHSDEAPAVEEPPADRQVEAPAAEEDLQGDRGGLSSILIVSLVLLLLALGSGVLLFVRRKRG